MVWTFIFRLEKNESNKEQIMGKMMSEQVQKCIRCAVYTRKSTEEGLDQDYNSIDAQKDAGHAYIASQRNEGWIAVADDYDDPAYSGGNIERPALQRLLKDIEDNKIDVIVVYKIDRLTRSLRDFSKMVDVFERHDVSFVSVTQQFNTTTSMGRLMLNILLSFAQFEREVTGERIRDKIAASKKKGMWTGGIPPLGYDVKDKYLVINKAEAATVRDIFKRYVELGASSKLVRELKLQGVISKSWTTKTGKYRPGKPIDKSLIHKMLNNRTYLGEIRHKESWYPGKHEAIINQELWDNVQSILKTNYRVRANHTRSNVHFLLKGMVFGKDGRSMTTWSTKKPSGKRYRYYLHTKDAKEYAGASGLPRIPANELESAVIEQVKHLLRTPPITKKTAEIASVTDNQIDEAKITVALNKIETVWGQLFPDEQTRIVKLLIEKVIIYPDSIDIRLRDNGIEQLALEIMNNNQEAA